MSLPRLSDVPLRTKLTLIIVGACSVTLLLASMAMALFEWWYSRATAARDAAVVADILGANAQAAVVFDDQAAAQRLLAALSEEPTVIAARLLDDAGRAIAEYRRAGSEEAGPMPADAVDEPRFLGDRFIVSRPMDLDGKRVGRICLMVDMSRVYDRVLVFVAMAAAVLVGSALIALLASSRLQRPVSAPILALAATARRVADDRDYSVRAPVHGHDEIGILTAAFNQMLAQIERRTDELAATNTELEQFAYIASHDLKEPLRMVTQYLSLLQRQIGPQLTDPQRRFVGYAMEGAERMQSLIEDLLSFTRTSHAGENAQPVDLAQVLAEVLRTLERQIADEGAVIEADPLPTVGGERTKLALLLQNLVGNAVKFHAPGRPPRVRITAREEGGWHEIAVADNGIGIDPAYHQAIFAVFHRLHRRDEYPGNGMGLAICRKIVEQHQGQLTLRSEPGVGSTFTIRLPVVTASAQHRSVAG